MDPSHQVDHLKHLREISKQLDNCKDNIEANWRLQMLYLALGVAVVLGLDTQVLEAQLLDASELNPNTLRAVSRLIVSLLLLYSFFQFGILLGEYRETKRAAFIAKTHAAPKSNEDDLVKNLENLYVENLDSTYTQFEFFFRESKDFRVWGVLMYLIAMNAIMHGLGAFLLYDASRNLSSSGTSKVFFVLMVLYAAAVIFLYIGHHKRINENGKMSDVVEERFCAPLKKDALAKRAKLVGIVTVLGGFVVFFLLFCFTADRPWPDDNAAKEKPSAEISNKVS